MIGSISGYSSQYAPSPIVTQNRQQTAPVPEERASIPVQPVPAVRETLSNESKFSIESLLQQHDADPVGMATRMRIQYAGEPSAAAEGPERIENGTEAAKGAENTKDAESVEESKSPREVVEEEECQTCANRKYKDGSDDPGVSFKTATKLSPDEAASAVRGHEMEHVVRNRAKAAREDREIVSQSVMIHTAICPECGDVYTSGGTTRTVTRGSNENNSAQQKNQEQQRTPFFAVA